MFSCTELEFGEGRGGMVVAKTIKELKGKYEIYSYFCNNDDVFSGFFWIGSLRRAFV
jgi:hypothetical protein